MAREVIIVDFASGAAAVRVGRLAYAFSSSEVIKAVTFLPWWPKAYTKWRERVWPNEERRILVYKRRILRLTPSLNQPDYWVLSPIIGFVLIIF